MNREPPIFFSAVPALVPGQDMSLRSFLREGKATGCPWRFELDELHWRDLVARLAEDRSVFVGLWTDGVALHALFNDGVLAEVGVRPLMASLVLEGPRYPGLSRVRERAAPFERMVRDLWGIEAMDATDSRPLVDHDVWPVTAPLAARPGPAVLTGDTPEDDGFARAVPSGGMVFERGPASGGWGGPVHTRLGVADGRIQAVDVRNGYAHRGIQQRMKGVSLARAVELAGRVGGGTSVAHQWAFSRAVEQACGCAVSPAVETARALLCEVERILVHLTHLARVARVGGAAGVAARLYGLRETLCRLCDDVLKRRSLMDMVCPGGVLLPVMSPDFVSRECGAMPESGLVPGANEEDLLPALNHLCRELAVLGDSGLLHRLRSFWSVVPGFPARLEGKGRVDKVAAQALETGGPAARACGMGGDLRQYDDAYAATPFRAAVVAGGDVAARCAIRFDEIEQGLKMLVSLDRALHDLSAGDMPLSREADLFPPVETREGCAAVEGAHGPVWWRVVLRNGLVEHAFLADPAPALQMVLETALVGAAPEDFDLISASFGISAAAVDL